MSWLTPNRARLSKNANKRRPREFPVDQSYGLAAFRRPSDFTSLKSPAPGRRAQHFFILQAFPQIRCLVWTNWWPGNRERALPRPGPGVSHTGEWIIEDSNALTTGRTWRVLTRICQSSPHSIQSAKTRMRQLRLIQQAVRGFPGTRPGFCLQQVELT